MKVLFIQVHVFNSRVHVFYLFLSFLHFFPPSFDPLLPHPLPPSSLSLSPSSVVRLSSPKLNYLIGIGAILLYINIILVVVPLEENDKELANALCYITPWFTAVGYSLCYGTILVKLFRTWYIFNKPVANKKQVMSQRDLFYY